MKKTNIIIAAIAFITALSVSGSTAHAAGKLNDLESIHDACTTKAVCESNANASVTLVRSEENPYDVIYDYGEEYQKYIDACDWSLVFDADYYEETFPMLAEQYHHDEDLLLKHFQTVGVHEGRQGCKDFNVGAYLYNCDSKVYKAFKQDFASYYIYYMLNYDTEKAPKDKEIKKQYTAVLTWYQKAELARVNKYREEAGSDPVEFDSELAAFANYRAYLNAHDGYKNHDWLDQNIRGTAAKMFDKITGSKKWSVAENTVTWYSGHLSSTKICAGSYRKSKEHYEAMINPKYPYIGISNCAWDQEGYDYSQFDFYMNDALNTALHP